jgi:hypothetical protein
MAATAPIAATASAAAAAGAGPSYVGPRPNVSRAASGCVPQCPTVLNPAQAPALLSQAQPNFSWVLLPPPPSSTGDVSAPALHAALPLSSTHPIIGAPDPPRVGTLVPVPLPASMPNSYRAAAPGSSAGSGTDSGSDKDSPPSCRQGRSQRANPPHRAREDGTERFAALGQAWAAFDSEPEGTTDGCFTALDGIGKLPQPVSSAPGKQDSRIQV